MSKVEQSGKVGRGHERRLLYLLALLIPGLATASGIRRHWPAATLTQAGRVTHVEAFIDLLAARAMPARRRPLTVPRARRR